MELAALLRSLSMEVMSGSVRLWRKEVRGLLEEVDWLMAFWPMRETLS